MTAQLFQRWLRSILLAVFALTLLGAAPAATQAAPAPGTPARAALSGQPSQARRTPPEATTQSLRYICGQTVTLRPYPGGPVIGTLYYGDAFNEVGRDGAWSYGYAYRLGQWGWVLTQYLC